METMKKAYHSACKEEKLAASRETNSKLESNNNPEAQKKLQEKVEKCQQEAQKVGLPLENLEKVYMGLVGCYINIKSKNYNTRSHLKFHEFISSMVLLLRGS